MIVLTDICGDEDDSYLAIESFCVLVRQDIFKKPTSDLVHEKSHNECIRKIQQLMLDYFSVEIDKAARPKKPWYRKERW